MLKTLSFIADRLNNKKIIWGVGGSLLLNFYKLIDKPNDIDILVDEANATQLNEEMSSIGRPKEAIRSNPFRTTYFSKYSINEIDIDIMGGFAIQHKEGVYKLSFKQESIVAHKKINGLDIPLCSLEDWYILYLLIPNKQEKAILIENYLRTNGVKYPRLLEEALKQSLPLEVKGRVKGLLS
ncbi:nucleotidyltransferase domain-containing protein [Virgibacillus litoralis]|uniref:Nucleotidyl transferase AbiEii/AbiGii toxin family protein n=1 Tax=Virgibacillus litoralis TaxID=578221 RepID=A0ABS4HET1_9BACI|nr:hypothetical protein [Virgibacillus litoralis]MBP1949421.1 hypothetical protein [Virgibacillus litoralis]